MVCPPPTTTKTTTRRPASTLTRPAPFIPSTVATRPSFHSLLHAIAATAVLTHHPTSRIAETILPHLSEELLTHPTQITLISD